MTKSALPPTPNLQHRISLSNNLPPRYQTTLRTTAQEAVLSLCCSKSGGMKPQPVQQLRQAFVQAAAQAQQQQQQGDQRWWMLLESALACIDKVAKAKTMTPNPKPQTLNPKH